MKIELHEISIKEITEGYVDNAEKGVVGYNGKLNIRPPYQREFVYKEDQRNAVIETILKGFPLNVMYWVKTDDESFEVLDGQQRTISFCQYHNRDFSYKERGIMNLTQYERDIFYNYKCMVYICEGNDKEKLDWFKIINIAGEKLTSQELRNAVYTGPWLSDAKEHFSKTGCVAYNRASAYINKKLIRQEYLETALDWISKRDGITIEAYMAKNQFKSNCNELWLYFQNVINWIETLFPPTELNESVRKLMKGLEWGVFFNKYYNSTKEFDAKKLKENIYNLMQDEEVTNPKGIFEYLLSGNEKYLSLRQFDDKTKALIYAKQAGYCPICHQHFEISKMEGDHIVPWSKGGRTTPDNCQMLCVRCNQEKSNKG